MPSHVIPKQPKIRTVSPLHAPITSLFLEEMTRYKLRFQCEDCTLFNEITERCLHGFPTEPHRKHYFEHQPLGKVLIFCREFALD